MKRMLKLGVAVLSVAMLSLAVSPDVLAREKKVKVPCQKEGLSNGKEIRAYAMGTSKNMEAARQKALASARTTMASYIETVIKMVNENYLSSYEVDAVEDYRGSFNQVGRNVVNRVLNFAMPVCEEALQDKKTKQYKVHIALSLDGDKMSKIYGDALSADQKLRTDFEREKFLRIFHEEMENYAKQQTPNL